jgi:hypothetical protein
MPADLDQFGRKDSDGAVIGWKGLVKLGHMAANGRRLVDQINPKTRSGKIKRGLNPADPSADNHHISEINVRESLMNTVRETFANLVFNSFQCFFHFLSPHVNATKPEARNPKLETIPNDQILNIRNRRVWGF